GTFMKRRTEECYDLIKNMTAHQNDWDTLAQRSESSSSITSSFDSEIIALKAEMAEINKNLMKVLQINQQVKAVTPSCGTFMKRRPEECYNLIENMTDHHNDWDTLAQWSESSSSITSSFDTEISTLKAKMTEINKNLMRVLQVNQQVKADTPNCETCGGPYSFNDCPATIGQTQNVYVAGAYQGIKETIILREQPRKELILLESYPWSKPTSSLSSTSLSSTSLSSSSLLSPSSSTSDSSTASRDYQ
nr:hypothetical protein [Tanacetum cinerariifolium]